MGASVTCNHFQNVGTKLEQLKVDGRNWTLRSIWIQLILLKIENWKHCSKIIFKCVKNYCSLFFYCSYALVYYSCPMINAQGAVLKKKKTQMLSAKRGSKPNLNGSVWIKLIVVETKTENWKLKVL